MSNKRKYTPGPWGQSKFVTGPNGEGICLVNTTNKPHEQAVANILLISAAPETLEALEALTDAIEDFFPQYESFPPIADAMKKAELIIEKATKP